MSRSGEIPPGVHIQAVFASAEGRTRQLRILGDDRRGYLVAGITGTANDGDFWFRTLDEALSRAERLGVRRDEWTEITAVGQAQMQ
jgi:hypothetical protein